MLRMVENFFTKKRPNKKAFYNYCIIMLFFYMWQSCLSCTKIDTNSNVFTWFLSTSPNLKGLTSLSESWHLWTNMKKVTKGYDKNLTPKALTSLHWSISLVWFLHVFKVYSNSCKTGFTISKATTIIGREKLPPQLKYSKKLQT